MRCKKKPVVTPASSLAQRLLAARGCQALWQPLRARAPIAHWGSLRRCKATTAMDEWRSELEALQRLLASQQLQIEMLQKQLGVPADAAEEVDVPAAEYRRVFLVGTLFLLYDSAMMLIITFASGRGDEGNLGQVESVIWPICWTVMFGILLGTMDSSVAGRHALLLIRCWLSSQVVIIPILYWSSGKYEEAIFMLFVFIVNLIYWSWLGKVVLEILRARGGLATQAEHYSVRALKVLGFQILLGIAALAQGVNGRESYARLYATFVFSVALSCVWIFMVVIYDVCSVDGRAAVKLRLSPLQAMALATSGLYALSGLAAYLIANQRRPSKRAANGAGYLMMVSGLVSRLAAVARRGQDIPPASSVKPVDALGSLDVLGA